MSYTSIFKNKKPVINTGGYKSIYDKEPVKEIQPVAGQPQVKTLPDFLGGGSYNSIYGQPNTLVKTDRDYAGIKSSSETERHHIIPVEFGGDSTMDKNIEALGIEAHANITKQEKLISSAYNSGVINLPQARLKMMKLIQDEQNKAQGIKQGTGANFLDALKQKSDELKSSFLKAPGELVDQMLKTVRASTIALSTPLTGAFGLVKGGATPKEGMVESLTMAKEMIDPNSGQSLGYNVEKAAQQYLKKYGEKDEKFGGYKATPKTVGALTALGIFNLLGDPAFEAPAVIKGAEALKETALFKKVGSVKKPLAQGVKTTKPIEQTIKLSDDLKIKIKPKTNSVVLEGYKRRFTKGQVSADAFYKETDELVNATKELTGSEIAISRSGDDLILQPKGILKQIEPVKPIPVKPVLTPQAITPIKGEYYRYETIGTENNNVKFFSKQSDYVDEYKYVREQNGKTGKIIKENIELKNPLIVNAKPKEFSDPTFEKSFIDKAIKEGNDGVVFRSPDGDEFIAKIKSSKAIAPKQEPVKETFTPKISKSITAKAIEDGVPKETFNKLPEVEKIHLKEQIAKATEFINTDVEKARAVVRGEEPLPGNVNATQFIAGIEEYIKKYPDADMAYELANSELTKAASIAGQEVVSAKLRTPDSFTSKMIEIKKAREKSRVPEIEKKKSGAKKSLKEEINKDNLSKEDKLWENFLDDISC
jgi:hypothetical protein